MARSRWVASVASRSRGRDWRSAFNREFRHAKQVVESGGRIWMDHYGLTSESEFFAVSTEACFQSPQALAHYHPNVYELLLLFYRSTCNQLSDRMLLW